MVCGTRTIMEYGHNINTRGGGVEQTIVLWSWKWREKERKEEKRYVAQPSPDVCFPKAMYMDKETHM